MNYGAAEFAYFVKYKIRLNLFQTRADLTVQWSIKKPKNVWF